MALIPVDAALERVLEGINPLPAEEIPLHDGMGRVLASPLHALRTQPPFNASAMDGYAVRASDTLDERRDLSVIGEAAAGARFPGSMGQGQAVRIFTGAPVPDGADAVLIQENAESVSDRTIRAAKPVEHGRHIRQAGMDFHAGDLLLEQGRRLDPGALTLAASSGHARLLVHRRPRVAVLATGNELVNPGETTGQDSIVASNSYGIAAIAKEEGAEIIDLGIASDNDQHLSSLFAKARDTAADILVTLGGASVGKHDLVRGALAEAGMELSFWKVAMRPGKPLISGRMGAMHVLGLPGNPVSSLVCAELFLRPLVAHMQGARHEPDMRSAALGAPLRANDERQDYIRAVVRHTAEGMIATPFTRQDSSQLTAYATANCLIIRKPHAPAANTGDDCRILMLHR
ncbi:gephyrin-like molybdotransferase Glp [Nitratireductor basaltis]|uniref:Molybdopterin molybdenumtransferase n=1 Tax=Nitratireductor basaltis TaxID=472175 RepID=A0A084UAI0_9HYPH|nr:gephyrin-like molybdotransferase Glp [Nitratireductor basaltis]KFB09966.1 Molybdenum cofactor synthesis domain-containing protein [Nitratireductor basaltis]